MRAWVVPWALVLISCISDLKPDVGALVQADLDAGQGSITGGGGGSGDPNEPGNNGGATNGGGSDGSGSGSGNAGGSNGKDGGVDTLDDAGDNPSDPDAGPVSDCKIKDSNPSKVVSFKKDIWPILSGCRCHDTDDPDQFGILEVGFVIDDYATLREGGDNTGTNVIIPGNACDSLILQKLSEDPPFGVRMPRDGPYLSVETRTLISDWIVEGARDN